jgi:phage gp29-like protein
MALLSLDIAGGPTSVQPQVARAAARPDRPDATEYGASGTPIFGGFLRERGEYNPDLVGLSAVYTYEQMRRSDAQVAATLMAIKLPILGAEWDVKLPDDASKVEKEAGEFVRECFFEDLDFAAVLRNALLMLDFGFAVHEDVWEIVGNRVRLAKLAARLPITAYRWLVDDSGENLAAFEQMGYRGSEYGVFQVPANKMDLFTMNQEGQNYTGLSLLRPMYQHWFMKSNLYKVDAIACERNGMGVPCITLGDNAKQEDIEQAKEWVQQLTTHERTGLVLPKGWLFSLEGVKGTLRDPKDSIAHHNEMISMAALTMFMMLGQSQHGSHSLGATMADFFMMSLEATSRQIARAMNQGTVRRLVDYNFDWIEHYPELVPQQIQSLKFDDVVKALQELAQFGVIAPDDELESWVRAKMGAPDADKATTRTLVAASTPSGGQVDPNAPGANAPRGAKGGTPKEADGERQVGAAAEGGDAGVDATAADQKPSAKDLKAAEVIRSAMSELTKITGIDVGSVHVDGSMGSPTEMASGAGAVLQGGSPDFSAIADSMLSSLALKRLASGRVIRTDVPEYQALGLKRAPKGAEKHLALSEIVGSIEKGRNDIAGALRAARPRIQAEIIHKLADAPVRKMHQVSVAPDEKLIAQIEEILHGISDFGRKQVSQERARQLAGKAPEDAAKIRMTDRGRKGDQLGLFADGVVSEFQNGLQQKATGLAIDKQKRGNLGKGELINSIGEDLDGQSDKWIDATASKGANEAFADGRQGGYEDYADEIGSVSYSSLLDGNTCGNCDSADGAEGDTPKDIPDVPNPDCDGGDKCRCVHVYVFKDEVRSEK